VRGSVGETDVQHFDRLPLATSEALDAFEAGNYADRPAAATAGTDP
jgi:hypothetical protein